MKMLGSHYIWTSRAFIVAEAGNETTLQLHDYMLFFEVSQGLTLFYHIIYTFSKLVIVTL